jgi:hypothetical protein
MTQDLRPTKDFIETWVKQFRTDNPRKQTLNALEIYTELEPAAVSAAGSGEIVSIRAQSDMSTINDILSSYAKRASFKPFQNQAIRTLRSFFSSHGTIGSVKSVMIPTRRSLGQC